MYESYVWPNAYHLKKERKFIIKWVMELFSNLGKQIAEREKHI